MRYRATAKPMNEVSHTVGETSGQWQVEIVDEGVGCVPGTRITKRIGNLSHDEAVAKVKELNGLYITSDYSG